MFGNHGRILKVDLSNREVTIEPRDEAYYRMFLGGNGLCASLIHESVPQDADPLGPENAIVFSVGPVTRSPLWGSSRGHIAAISPLTGFFADSNFGGDFPAAQKQAGFDAIFVTGKSESPVYLSVNEEGGEIKEAGSVWGMTTEQAHGALSASEGGGAQSVTIGPAGENGVLFACILGSGKRIGTAGRCGLGAVMGAKNLKAIVAGGNRKTTLADRDALTQVLKEKYDNMRANTAPLKELGTPVLVHIINNQGMMGTRNNVKEFFDHARDICGELIREEYWAADTACYGCPVACGKKVNVGKGKYVGETVKMPEYETLFALGSMMDVRDLQSVFNANHACNQLGLDTISMGVTLSFVAECMEKGIISEADLGGRVDFSDGEAMVELIEKTAHKDGIGEHLALGSLRLSRQFGKDASKYLYQVKGLEIAGHSARGISAMSLSYPVGTRGGSHHDGRPVYGPEDPGFEPQPRYIATNQNFTAVGDSMVLCRFVAERGIGTPLGDDMVKIVNSVTGWDLDLAGLEEIGERIYNLERLINVGRGLRRKHDTLPYRVLNEPIPDGPAKGRYCPREELDAMLDKYYSTRGWTSEGIPTDEKLSELGLKGTYADR
ncbi:MAG: aldehyde ferredoxin oxidoreductase family protein [Deltaproteobacteria bacterium]|nr:aldehyde ferredoxin oxidoreductase family protein [Deltaproteobacteria bacterium]